MLGKDVTWPADRYMLCELLWLVFVATDEAWRENLIEHDFSVGDWIEQVYDSRYLERFAGMLPGYLDTHPDLPERLTQFMRATDAAIEATDMDHATDFLNGPYWVSIVAEVRGIRAISEAWLRDNAPWLRSGLPDGTDDQGSDMSA